MADLQIMYDDCATYQCQVPQYDTPHTVNEATYWLFCMQNELAEVVNCMQWKKWKKYQPITQSQHEELQGEMVDVLFFFFHLCTTLNISMNELFKAFYKKLNINYKRIDEENN